MSEEAQSETVTITCTGEEYKLLLLYFKAGGSHKSKMSKEAIARYKKAIARYTEEKNFGKVEVYQLKLAYEQEKLEEHQKVIKEGIDVLETFKVTIGD